MRDGNAALWCLLLPLFVGCGGKAPADDTADAEDTAPPIYDPEDVLTFEGSLAYTSVRDGALICDVQVALQGTEYAGDCEDCEFAFVMEGTVSEDNSYSGCELDSLYSWVPSTEGYDLLLGYASDWTADGGLEYQDLLMTGFSASYEFGTFGPYWEYLAHSESGSDGSVLVENDQVTWAFERSTLEVESYNYYNACDELAWSEGKVAYGGDEEEANRVECDGSTVDVWEFDVAEGEEVAITLDTVSSDTAFDAWFWINDSEGCSVAAADDNHACTHSPIAYSCPALIFDGEPGVYQLVVQSLGQCTGENAGYVVRFQQDTDPDPRLVVNEGEYAVSVDVVVNVEGTGTVTAVQK